jgi:hypothetical protein
MAVNWRSTKFQHAAFVQLLASVALFTEHLSGSEWIAASTIALGIYTAGDVAQKFAREES